jgi:hypothetical protein
MSLGKILCKVFRHKLKFEYYRANGVLLIRTRCVRCGKSGDNESLQKPIIFPKK